MSENQRRDNLLALADKHDIEERGSYPDCDTSAEEDLLEMLNGTMPIERYAVVTEHQDGDGNIRYIVTRETLAAAQHRASEYDGDSIYWEVPVEIVDLDTGQRWVAGRREVQWRLVDKDEFVY